MNSPQKVLPKPVDWDELYPGRFIKAVDFKGKNVTLKIASVSIEELIGDKGPQIKGIIKFVGTDKALALNKTNGICLKAMFGKKVQEWVGHRVTLFPTKHGDDDAIRVFGSPELEKDLVITVALPRKRPFDMTMHRVVIGQARVQAAPQSAQAAAPTPTAESAPPAYTIEAAIHDLRECGEREALESLFAEITKSFPGEVPEEIEAAYRQCRDQFEEVPFT